MNTPETRQYLEMALFAAAIVLALVVGLTSATVQAAPFGGEPGAGCPHSGPGKFPRFDADHLPPHLRHLGLSEEQRKRIGELFEAQGRSTQDRLEAGRKAHQELRELALSDGYSDDKATALIQANTPAMAELALSHARLEHEVYLLLTAEQRTKLKDDPSKFGVFPPRHGGPRPE